MILRSLHIEGFGLHHDLRMDLGPGLNLIEGPNEAGKSTLHAFLTAMLHGLPRGGERFEPIAGGAHAGSLIVESKLGEIRIERSFSPRRRLRVERPDGSDGGEALLQELLGRVDSRLYRSVFAFDLSELL